VNTRAETPAAPLAAAPVQGRSLWMDARRRFMRNRSALISLFLLAVIAFACLFGPVLAPHAFDTLYWDRVSAPPDVANGHYFGTDGNGRDLFVRVLMGGRISLMVGLVATLVSLVIGVAWGAAAGYRGGWLDEILMRIVDVLYGIPFIFFVILLFVFFERSFIMIFVAIGAVEWLDMARVVRGQAISLRRREFIEAAHAIGLPTHRILSRHIIPNLLGPVIVFVTLTVPKVILLESFLSFLGLGVREPMTSWGVLINEGARSMTVAPWALVFPALFLSVTLFCFNYLGDGLRDALDPKDR
jgi:oligopeptide transport system permease protein